MLYTFIFCVLLLFEEKLSKKNKGVKKEMKWKIGEWMLGDGLGKTKG
ncbi:hypothetical protein BDCR2A_01946 [Borrelia duttonii CR2A]|uniref:Uncharacterized protein n=1 Tax=Borrelia duttonii CR2A TaxID=1432657 RepID=W6TFR0_9SPIR|nr:hypothetical protein [Borrelia duttonii]ETZ17135.1 hypothetical protein BDCR2A_01946 [Borrelia duttonii CR2A]